MSFLASLRIQALAKEVAGSFPSNDSAGETKAGWFSPQERSLIAALSAVIVPSDGNGPGSVEAQVDEKLDRLVASSLHRQRIYRQGLAAIDRLARRRFGDGFINLRAEQQLRLLELIDKATSQKTRAASGWIGKSLRRAYFAWSGIGTASRAFRLLVKDTLDMFYSSEVAWAWLRYSGPPFQSRRHLRK